VIKLYSGSLSLYSRKVEIALHEKGLAFEGEMVAFSQTQGYRPKHLASGSAAHPWTLIAVCFPGMRDCAPAPPSRGWWARSSPPTGSFPPQSGTPIAAA
jgi:hypothetical protein